MNHGGYQIGEVSSIPMVIVYVSFDKSKPDQYKRCQDAIAVLNSVAPKYEKNLLVYYSDEEA